MEQIEIDIGNLAKAKKRVWVKPTATKKGHYREMEVGRKEETFRERVEADARKIAAEVAAERAQMAEKNEYGIAMRDINEGDYIDLGPHYGGGYVVSIHDAERLFITDDKEDRYNQNARGWYVNLYDVQEVLGEPEDKDEDDDEGMYAPRRRDE